MKEKNLPLDYQHNSLEELTEKANSIIESLEKEKNLNNSVNSYQELLKLNNLIEKKFQRNTKKINEETKKVPAENTLVDDVIVKNNFILNENLVKKFKLSNNENKTT